MRTTVSLAVLISVLAGCAAPMPTFLATPGQSQPVPALTTPVTAAMAKLPAAPGKALILPTSAKTPIQPVTVAPVAAKAPLDQRAVTKKRVFLDDFDPMTILSALPVNVPSAPEDADDDSDANEDDSSSFSAKFLGWGWSGMAGLERGLRAFSKEEGRMVEWMPYTNGWTTMRKALTQAEIPGAVALAVSPLYNRTPTSYRYLSKTLQSHSKRHLKFFRRQDIARLRSRHLGYYQVQQIGTTAVAGYIARAEYGTDRYIAYYDGDGRFLWSYGTNYPAYGGGYGGGYSGYSGPTPDMSPSAEPLPAAPAAN
ncbi:MAG: hypothetical protein H7338_11095 [Candidatus Sericytochromatia bacterium]|nr:hypothetical protein [Candidatus Sericytochromatia bacterium]